MSPSHNKAPHRLSTYHFSYFQCITTIIRRVAHYSAVHVRGAHMAVLVCQAHYQTLSHVVDHLSVVRFVQSLSEAGVIRGYRILHTANFNRNQTTSSSTYAFHTTLIYSEPSFPHHEDSQRPGASSLDRTILRPKGLVSIHQKPSLPGNLGL